MTKLALLPLAAALAFSPLAFAHDHAGHGKKPPAAQSQKATPATPAVPAKGAGPAAPAVPAKPAAAAGAHAGHGAGHSMTIKTSIANGAIVTTRPTAITFTFSPAMRLDVARLSTATGETVPVTFDKTSTGTTAMVTFAALDPDTYTLSFNADAGDHFMPGKVKFTVR